MAQLGFYFNAKRCTGCKACVLACKDYKNLTEDQAFRNVLEYCGGEWTMEDNGAWNTNTFVYYISTACNHCANPACVAACPTGAMMKDEETGIVSNDPEVCIGCGACANACPYGAPAVDAEAAIAKKCDMCKARLDKGKKPICVEACPMRALEVGDIDELRAMYGDLVAIAPLPEPDATMPCYVMSEPANACPCGSDMGMLANERDNR